MDGYLKFFEDFSIDIEALLNWGIENIIFPDVKKVGDAWTNLKERIKNNNTVYIRGYGRNGHGTIMYQGFYEFLLGHTNVKQDPTNNHKPKQNIEKLTELKRNKHIFNYQVSHIFGCTKNIFLFEAPWNICYVPKFMDPFTGHEAKGEYIANFQKRLFETAYKRYENIITEYNQTINELLITEKIEEYAKTLKREFSDHAISQFVLDCKREFNPIWLEKK